METMGKKRHCTKGAGSQEQLSSVQNLILYF